MKTTPELALLPRKFRATPTGGPLTPTHDLTCNRPNTRRIFGGIGLRAQKSTPYHQATAASLVSARTQELIYIDNEICSMESSHKNSRSVSKFGFN
ncbi:hypothetical protein AVEN_113548-1 [Araneus ventricosus]|uniref:Uncharacterized protein n=1 Tax=Araneus ventricosus TaxID=182803 RepID=A0A4Y2G2U1_ARAVE|nr:hypothetical protein AVEN_113548-1 [Araneus ventricosus]